jgi:DNA end-binding protein Ku
MRAIWKGSISFGLVSIPIALYPATQREELKFRLLRVKDLSPVNYKRVAEADGKEVAWEDIVKGYEYDKGKYVVLKDDDFKRVDIEATQTVDILHFVKLEEINPMLFYKPYYLEPQKGGDKAYVLLRDVLADLGKIGVAKVVIKTRQHLAAIKPQKRGLILELMHFPEELMEMSEFKAPTEKSSSAAEKKMAKQLVESMSASWDPKMYQDDYHEALEKMIEEKIEHGEKKLPAPRRTVKPTKSVDLVALLQKSLRKSTHESARYAQPRSKRLRRAK